MARSLVLFTLGLWVVAGVVASMVLHEAGLLLVPLVGFCPWVASPGSHNERLITIWCVLAGCLYLGLALIAVVQKSKPAAVTFLLLFLVSTIACAVRMLAMFNNFIG
jgi:hypothetical protein